MPTKVIAGCLALGAFAIAIVAGLSSGNTTDTILGRALLCMVVCYAAGLAVGAVAERAMDEHIAAHEAAHPEVGDARVETGESNQEESDARAGQALAA